MPEFKELVKNLYTSKNRELTDDKLSYIESNYKGKEEDFVKNFYATIGEELTEEKFNYIRDTYLKKNETQLPKQSKLPSKQPLPKGTDSFSGVWTPSQPSKSASGLGGSTLKQGTPNLFKGVGEKMGGDVLSTPQPIQTEELVREDIAKADKSYYKNKTKEEAISRGYETPEELLADRMTYLTDGYLTDLDQNEYALIEAFRDAKKRGSPDADKIFSEYLDVRSKQREEFLPIQREIDSTREYLENMNKNGLLAEGVYDKEINKLEEKQKLIDNAFKPVYNPQKAMNAFVSENANEIAKVSEKGQSAHQMLGEYINALYTEKLEMQKALGLDDDKGAFSKGFEEWLLRTKDNIGVAPMGERYNLDKLYNLDLKLRSAVKLYTLNRSGVQPESTESVFAKTFAQTFVPSVQNNIPTVQQIAENVNSVIEESGIVDAVYKERDKEIKESAQPYEFLSPKWMAQNTAPSLAIMLEFIPASALSATALSKFDLGRKIMLLSEANKTNLGGRYLNKIATTRVGKGLVQSLSKGAEYGVQSSVLSTMFPEQQDEMNFVSGVLAGAGGSLATKGAKSLLNPTVASVSKIFGKATPQAANIIKEYGSRLTSNISEKAVGELTEETIENLTSLYRSTENYQEFKTKVIEQFGSLDKATEYVTSVLIMGLGMGAGSELGKSMVRKGESAYQTLTTEQKAKVDEILNEVTSEEEKLQNDLVNEELKNAGTSTIEQPIEGGTIQPITTPQADSGTIEEGVAEANLQTEIDEKAQTEEAEVGVLDSDTALPTDGVTEGEATTVQVENVPLTNEGNKLETPVSKGVEVSENVALRDVENASTVDNTIAADYLTTGGINTVISTDYLLKGIAGFFSNANSLIDNIRNKYAKELADKNLVDIKNFVGTDTYNKIISEIKEALDKTYNNNIEVQKIFDEILKFPTGMPQRVGLALESRHEKAVEELLTNKQGQSVQPTTTPALSEQETEPLPVEQTGTDVGGVTAPNVSPLEVEAATEQETADVAKKSGISPKNLKDLYNANRQLFGLSKVKSLASAIAMDRMIGAMAKRAGVTKAEMYGRLEFEKAADVSEIPFGIQNMLKFQAAMHGSPYVFPKEILVEYNDGTKEYLVGTETEFPKVPNAAKVIKKFPNGRFRLDKIGTGEGAQAFGWGLYFTDIESIARNYADKLAKGVSTQNYLHSFLLYNFGVRANVRMAEYIDGDLSSGGFERIFIDPKYFNHDIYGDFYENKNINNHLNNIKENLGKIGDVSSIKYDSKSEQIIIRFKPKTNKNLYKVSLHKGKSPSEYTWLEWDKEVPLSIGQKIEDLIIQKYNLNYADSIEEYEKGYYEEPTEDSPDDFILKNKYDGVKGDLAKFYSGAKGKDVYDSLAESFRSGKLSQEEEAYKLAYEERDANLDKKASLLLLEAGIDGIKYPAESIARGATSDTARGSNYVVFDENAVSIEEVIKFQRDAEKARGAAMVNMDGTAVIYALTDPNVSTPLHELAHVFEHYLSDTEKNTIIKNAGTKGWTTETSEYFARGFEKYLAEGKSPIESLNKVFEKFKQWLTDIYNGITNSAIDIKLNKEMRGIYDKMLGLETETVQLTPEQKEKHNRQAKDLGWDNAPQAINSINKRLGTDYKSWESIPKHVKEYVSSFRNAVEKQKTEFNVALKAAYKYLDMAVKDGTITRDEADSLANMAAKKATPKTEKKGTLAEAVGATTEINQADLKNKKITMLKAMREKFNSFFKGVRAGKKDERTVRKIEQSVAAELRKEAKAYRDSLGINMNSVPNKSKLSMAARMATIRTVGDFMRFKEYVDNIAKKADFYEKVSAARKLAKKISKINPSKLTATDKEFIAKIEFLDAKYVSDIDEYVKILNEFYDAKNNPQKYASKDIKTRLSEYLAKEQEYVDGVKEAKRIEIEEAQAEDDRLLAETAIASGTYSGTIDEFIEDLQLSRKETIDSNAEEQEAIADARDKIREAKVSGDEVNEIAVKAFFRTIAPQIKDAFEQAGLIKEYAALKKWAESGTTEKNVLNSEQSALLGNILQNIDESQDFSGITVATGAIKLANKANDINSLNPTFRKLRDKRNYTPIGLATALSTSRELANKLQDMILTSWDSLIAKGRKFHAEKMGEFKRVMKTAGVNTFSQEMRIDTFAFINQWFTDLTVDEQVAHFQSRVAKRAQDAKYIFNQSSKNVGERNRLDQRKAEETIKALESFGLIEDVVFTDLGKGVREVDFKVVEGKTPTDIQNALTVGERKVYDHINGLFNSMQGKIKNSVITGTNQAWREITNYYPTFTESMNLTDDEVKSRLLFAGSMFNVSRTSGNAKARIDDISKIASERRTYKSGLFETMNTGLWENIIIAEMQTERNYVVSLFSDKSPMRGLLGDYDFKKTRDVLWSKYTEDLASFNIPKEETTIGSELAKAASNMMVGFILKNPTQLYKQIGGYFATMVHYPKESTMAFRLIQELHGSPQARMLVESMSTLGRDPVALQDIHSSDFPADYILNKKKRMTIKAIREMSSFADKFGDIIMPATKKIVPKAPQEFNSLMEYTDNINNNYIAWAGYIHALMKQKGLKDYASVRAEIFNQMASGSLDKELIQQSERWVETMNSASNKSNYPTILTTERLTYWMKSFSFITYNMYEENALAAKEANNQEEKDHFKRQAAMYRTQAIYFRVVSAITQQAAIEGLVYLVNSLMTDDDDEEKKKEVRYKLEAMGLGVVASLLMDLKFANKSVWADISAAVIANAIWLIYSANEKDKLSETDPDFDPNSYAKNITIEPKAGGAIMSALDFGKKTAEEAIKEYLTLKKAEVNIPTNIKETMFYIPAFATGSGTGRMVAAALDKPQDETIKKIGTLVTYGLRGQQVEDAIEILKDVKPEDVRKHIFALRMGKNLKSYVYIVDKEFYDTNVGKFPKEIGDKLPILTYQTTRDKTKQQKANRNAMLEIQKTKYMQVKPFEVDHFDPKFFKEMEEEQATQENTNEGDED